MNILALETTGKFGSAAVIRDDSRVFVSSSSTEMNHLKDIITTSDDAIRAAGITKKDLTHVAASVGPGSFTGIRIGVTSARTLGQMLGIPCIGVSSLLAMCERVRGRACDAGADCIVSIINARRHQVYAGAWMPGGPEDKATGLRVMLPEKQYMIEELIEELRGRDVRKVFFTGDGIDAYEDIIREMSEPDRFILAGENERYQNAGEVALIAAEYAASGRTVGFNDLMPEYMRLAEAEQRLKAGTLSDKIKRTFK